MQLHGVFFGVIIACFFKKIRNKIEKTIISEGRNCLNTNQKKKKINKVSFRNT